MNAAQPMQSFNPPSRSARLIAGVAFVVTLTVGLASAVWGIAQNRDQRALAGLTMAQVLNGHVTDELSKQIAHAPLATSLAKIQRAGSWLGFGSLGPQVRRGCAPWLFLQDELTVHANAAHNAMLRGHAVARVRDLLKSRGVELIVATVPDKSRVQSEYLCRLYRPDSFEMRLERWQILLRQQQIHAAALLSSMVSARNQHDTQPFLTVDTHWSEAGAQAAARAIGAVVSRLGVQLMPERAYRLKPGTPQSRAGDLVRLAGIDWLPERLQPPPDIVRATRFSVVDTPASSGSATVDDLFGDANVPTVALVGTSFSGASAFAQFLEAELHTSVPSFAKDGGDFWRSIRGFLESSDYQLTPPKLVIWEIPERVIQMPITPDERDWMRTLGF